MNVRLSESVDPLQKYNKPQERILHAISIVARTFLIFAVADGCYSDNRHIFAGQLLCNVHFSQLLNTRWSFLLSVRKGYLWFSLRIFFRKIQTKMNKIRNDGAIAANRRWNDVLLAHFVMTHLFDEIRATKVAHSPSAMSNAISCVIHDVAHTCNLFN